MVKKGGFPLPACVRIVAGFVLSVFSLLSLGGFLSTTQAQPETVPSNLLQVTSFEVKEFHDIYDLRRQHNMPELYGYLKTALENQHQLPLASPAQGQIKLTCKGIDCHRLETTVLVGPNDQVVWKDSLVTHQFFYTLQQDPRRLAETIAKRLANAYADHR